MAYADQSMSGNKITALIVVALLHILLGYALVTGLAYEAVKKVAQKVTTIDIEEEVKKEEPPPPPPKKLDVPPPPIKPLVVPPTKLDVNVKPVEINTQPTPEPTQPRVEPVIKVEPTQEAPRFTAKAATPKGRGQGNWISDADYPSRAQNEEREGSVRYRLAIGPDGRVTGCEVTGSSGHADLDAATCSLITRRAKFNPAISGDTGQPIAGSFSGSVRWTLPKE